MKKLLIAILFVLVSVSGFAAGTTVDDRTGQDIVGLSKIGIGTSTPAVGFVNTGFSKLGDLAPNIKIETMVATFGANEGGATAITPTALGSKILFVTGVAHIPNYSVFPNYDRGSELSYSFDVNTSTNVINIQMHPTDSGSLVNLGVTVYIFYTD